MQDTKEDITKVISDFDALCLALNLDDKQKRINEIEARSTVEGFWNDQETARNLMQELGDLKKEFEEVESLKETTELLKEFLNEDSLSVELATEVRKAKAALKRLEISTLLSAKFDKNNAIFGIHSGQGGTEAMDWADMVYRMYTRLFERRGWKVEVLDYAAGEEAGIKGVTLKVTGSYAYGYLKHEAGTHRLVRQSPFNADNLRQTSFALVEVLPELTETDASDIEMKEEDLEWQFYRAGGHGGQNVNKVSTAVRVTHIPSGIVVTAQTERFQQQNRKNALDLLRAKLWIKKQEEERNTVKNIKGNYQPASWGTQIRSYVLHPYKMVKDLRTEVESSNPDSVLDGELDDFIEAELRMLK